MGQFKNHDYRSIFNPTRAEDGFLYLDPPYDSNPEKSGFTAYFGNEFGWGQQQELVEWAAQWECPVVISNLGTSRIVTLYERAGYEIEYIQAPRSISCDGNREKVWEILAKKGFTET
ncbi:MAG: hypothetical protein HC778_04620 [Chamaesiphon sp. CSU_1_12]|nr:hypothetical protein [Chamaesiphon sp. CSU_1_12]